MLSLRSINYLIKISVLGMRNSLMYLIRIIHETPKTINCLSCLPEVKNKPLLLKNPCIQAQDWRLRAISDGKASRLCTNFHSPRQCYRSYRGERSNPTSYPVVNLTNHNDQDSKMSLNVQCWHSFLMVTSICLELRNI